VLRRKARCRYGNSQQYPGAIYNKNMTVVLRAAGCFTSGCYGESAPEQGMSGIGDLYLLALNWVVERGID
jgi:hypothetical protein